MKMLTFATLFRARQLPGRDNNSSLVPEPQMQDAGEDLEISGLRAVIPRLGVACREI